MADNLQKARALAARVRFFGDVESDGGHTDDVVDAVRDLHLVNELNISPAVTPSLHKSLDAVLKHFSIPPSAAEAFVYASSETQAVCFSGGKNGCVIRFSSALVDILDADEFKFIAGHELGHFLLKHRPCEKSAGSPEHFMRQRAREISSDRMGLIACGGSSLTAIKAMMKVISGLTGKHLRFDVGAFLSQLQKISGNPSGGVWNAAHPPVLVRCRALAWFAMSEYFSGGDFSAAQLSALDKKIQKDLDKYVDGPLKEQIRAAKEAVRMWTAVRAIVADNKFDAREQEKFAADFGRETCDKLKKFLRGIPPTKVRSEINKKLKDAKARCAG